MKNIDKNIVRFTSLWAKIKVYQYLVYKMSLFPVIKNKLFCEIFQISIKIRKIVTFKRCYNNWQHLKHKPTNKIRITSRLNVFRNIYCQLFCLNHLLYKFWINHHVNQSLILIFWSMIWFLKNNDLDENISILYNFLT